jgi:uncharacterized protein (DUF58 family)
MISALLRVLAALIGALVAAGLALLAALLLLLAVTIRLRFLFVLLVGVISHFPSPCAAHHIMARHRINPAPVSMLRRHRRDVAGAGRVILGPGNCCALDRFIR